MACKFCYQETSLKGEPVFEKDGSPAMLCDVECLPIRGRMQRLVYSSIFDDAEYPEVIKRVHSEDSSIAQSNISRAINNLKASGYIVEGLFDGKRIFSRQTEIAKGYVDDDYYAKDVISIPPKVLRQLLSWFIARRGRDSGKNFHLKDEHIVEIAGIVLESAESFDMNNESTASCFRKMEPLVKKMRYIVGGLQDKKLPVTETLARSQVIENWEKRSVTPLRKKAVKDGGWAAFVPFFRDEWEALHSNGTVHPRMSQAVNDAEKREAEAQEFFEIIKDKMGL